MWPPKGIETFDPWHLPLLNTLILLTSGTTVTWAHHALLQDDRQGAEVGPDLHHRARRAVHLRAGLRIRPRGFSFKGHIYGATFFMATGFHGAHVLIGTIFLIVCLLRAYAGHFTPKQHLGFEFAAWYWHFVDVVWLFLFACIYVWGCGRERPGGGALNRRHSPAKGRPRGRPFVFQAASADDYAMSKASGSHAAVHLDAGLPGRCPRCGEGNCFRGFLDVRTRCERCGLDYAFVDAGDGPAVFVILIRGFIVVFAALIVEVDVPAAVLAARAVVAAADPAGDAGAAAPDQGAVIALQYHHKAAEGRLEREDKP